MVKKNKDDGTVCDDSLGNGEQEYEYDVNYKGEGILDLLDFYLSNPNYKFIINIIDYIINKNETKFIFLKENLKNCFKYQN